MCTNQALFVTCSPFLLPKNFLSYLPFRFPLSTTAENFRFCRTSESAFLGHVINERSAIAFLLLLTCDVSFSHIGVTVSNDFTCRSINQPSCISGLLVFFPNSLILFSFLCLETGDYYWASETCTPSLSRDATRPAIVRLFFLQTSPPSLLPFPFLYFIY